VRHVQIDEGLRLRFPRRSAEFDEGVEVGMAAALMASATRTFSRRIATGTVDQIRALAPRLGFHVVVEAVEGGWADLSFRPGPERPRLTLAHSGAGRPEHPVATRDAALELSGAVGLSVTGQPAARRRAELRCV
jgi:hypothetical protein